MLEIKPLLTDQWPILKVVRLAALADAPEAFSATLSEALALTDQDWQQRAQRFANSPRDITRIAYWDTIPAGMIGCHLLEADPETSNLVAVWVAPSFRKQGVGEALIEEAIAWSKEHGVQKVQAWVTEHNIRAIRFYERTGFERTSLRQPYRPDPTKNEVLFVRNL